MNDTTLLVLLGDKNTYQRFKPLVKDHVLSKDCLDIYRVLDTYYKSYPTITKINWEEFSTFFFMAKGKLKPEKAVIYRSVLENCAKRAVEVDGKDPADLPDFYKEVFNYYIKLDYLNRITEKALTAGATLLEGDDITFEELEKLLTEAKKELGTAADPSSAFVSTSLLKVAGMVSSPGLEWPLEELNESLGPARPKDFILFAARPEVGKSTWISDVARFWVKQLKPEDGPILYINNEQASDKVMFRVQQSYFGVTNQELEHNAAIYDAKYQAEVGNRILVTADDSGYNSTGKLDRLFKELKPSVIIFDQLDKVEMRGDFARDDIRIGKIYEWARNKAKEHNAVVVALSQVDGSGEGGQWLSQAQLRGSKTDKPGEPDAIIMCGREPVTAGKSPKEYSRYLHITKNKLLGGPKSKEEYRHGYYEVQIKPEIARYVGRKAA
jgi:replicative DNA helicase